MEERQGADGEHDPLVRPPLRDHGRHARLVSIVEYSRIFRYSWFGSVICCFSAWGWFHPSRVILPSAEDTLASEGVWRVRKLFLLALTLVMMEAVV